MSRQGLRLFGHPLHAVLSDFPIALLGTSLVWDVLGLVRHERLWWAIAFWTMAMGLAAACATAFTGLWDYAGIEETDPAAKAGTCHMVLMLLAASLYGISLIVRGGAAPPVGPTLIAALTLESFGLLFLTLGGWFGGHLVFHYGVGRDS